MNIPGINHTVLAKFANCSLQCNVSTLLNTCLISDVHIKDSGEVFESHLLKSVL